MIKKIGYILFAIMYYIGCLFSVNKKKYFCVMTHDESEDSSVGVVIKAIKERVPDAEFVRVTKSSKSTKGLIDLIIRKSLALADSGTILMDNEFIPLGYIRIRKDVKVVQLWHGTGTIKKFGHDSEKGAILNNAIKADRKITHLVVNSEYTARLYQGAFGVTEDKVYLTGVPRTDVLFDNIKRDNAVNTFFNEYPGLKDKKLVLYAPTFRDSQVDNPRVELNLTTWCDNVAEDTVLLLRLHPRVAEAYEDTSILQYGDRIINMSSYKDLNTLLFVSDALITDYSSIVFEYVLRDCPMYFFAYDFEEFSNLGRGFYEVYDEFVPGPVVRTTKQLIEAMNQADSYKSVREQFKTRYYRYLDGKSTERLLNVILQKHN